MNKFLFDTAVFIWRNLPSFLRLPRFTAWMTALLAANKSIHDDFLQFRDGINLQLSYNSQSIILGYALNQYFPIASGGILIVNPDVKASKVRLGYRSEINVGVNNLNGAIKLGYRAELGGAIGLGYRNEMADNEYDFTVYIPSGLTPPIDENILKAIVKRYVFSGRRFNLFYY
jgi:hypothetical protein